MQQTYLLDALAYTVIVLCVWAILSPRVPTCIGGSAGLGAIGIAAMLTLDDYSQPHVITLMLAGTAAIGLQVLWMAYRHKSQPHLRRLSDWAPPARADDPPREIDAEQQQFIAGGRK